MWVGTTEGMLLHISLGDEASAMCLASLNKEFPILYSAQDELWIQEHPNPRIVQLRLQNNGLVIAEEKYLKSHVNSMYQLTDGAWILIEDYKGYTIWSPSLERIICEEKSAVLLSPPFIVQIDRNHCYYTEDPRRGWTKMPIEVEGEFDHVAFFAKHGDVRYVAIYRDLVKKTMLYRFSSGSAMDAERVWEISERLYRNQFAIYNGLVCITDEKPLVVYGHKDAPQNHGFLVWNPQSNAFFEDIPQFSIVHIGHIIPRNLQIPAAWSDREDEQHIQDV